MEESCLCVNYQKIQIKLSINYSYELILQLFLLNSLYSPAPKINKLMFITF